MILKDLLKKCGPGGSGKLTINYKLKLGLRILAVTVNPAVNNKFNFKCPDITSKLEVSVVVLVPIGMCVCADSTLCDRNSLNWSELISTTFSMPSDSGSGALGDRPRLRPSPFMYNSTHTHGHLLHREVLSHWVHIVD
jgi:hypothetical protein